MVASSRGILAIGLSLAGLAYLVAPTLGQGQQQDGSVRKDGEPVGQPHLPRRSHRSSARSISSSSSRAMKRSRCRTRNTTPPSWPGRMS